MYESKCCWNQSSVCLCCASYSGLIPDLKRSDSSFSFPQIVRKWRNLPSHIRPKDSITRRLQIKSNISFSLLFTSKKTSYIIKTMLIKKKNSTNQLLFSCIYVFEKYSKQLRISGTFLCCKCSKPFIYLTNWGDN